MPLTGEYRPSTADWARTQAEKFESSGGAEANTMRGKPIIVLTTVGARTGALRKTALMRVEHDGRYAVVASKGGTPEPPAWYLNLKAEPQVRVQVRDDVFAAHARDATPEEQPELWRKMAAVWPDYDEYQRRTERRIPVVVLERA